MSGRRAWLALWLLLSAGWIGFIALRCLRGWPRIPLDVSATDPATRAAFDRAVMLHVVQCGIVGLLPPLALLVLGWLMARLLRGLK